MERVPLKSKLIFFGCCITFITFPFSYISSVFTELLSLFDIDSIFKKRKVRRNYEQTGDLAYFEDAGRKGLGVGAKGRGATGCQAQKMRGLLLVTDTALTNES